VTHNGATRAVEHAAPMEKPKGFPTGAWKTLRVSPTPHSPYDNHGVISIELPMGTFLKSVDNC